MKKIVSIILALAMILSMGTVMAEPELTCKAAIVIDFDSGAPIYEYNADQFHVPASMTKVMAAYVFFSEMQNAGLTLDSEILISHTASQISMDHGLSNVPLKEGWTYTADRLMSALFTPSGCGATVALAEAISGSEEEFVDLMNSFAMRMGLSASFDDCFGISAENSITPRSMAELSRRIITDYPVCLKYASATSITWDGKTYKATNLLLPGMEYAYDGVDGLKTGTTDEGGCCITVTALRDGRRVIACVFGAPNNAGRYGDAVSLLDYGFANLPANGVTLGCGLTSPEQVYFDEDFTVAAEIQGVPDGAEFRGGWLVNGIPIAGYQYDGVRVADGEKLYFDYNPCFYDGDALDITLRLYTANGSLEFSCRTEILRQYKPAGAPSKAIERETADESAAPGGSSTSENTLQSAA